MESDCSLPCSQKPAICPLFGPIMVVHTLETLRSGLSIIIFDFYLLSYCSGQIRYLIFNQLNWCSLYSLLCLTQNFNELCVLCRECTYNAALRHVHVTTVVVEKNKYYTFVCVRVCACVCPGALACAYPCLPCLPSMQRACAVFYCHLWLIWLQHIFRQYLINGTIFEKKKVLSVKPLF
jgi:hypothetical protein